MRYFGLICTSLASLTLYSFYWIFFHLAAILEICKIYSEDAIFQLANIGFWIQYTKIPLRGISKHFLYKNACTFLNQRLLLDLKAGFFNLCSVHCLHKVKVLKPFQNWARGEGDIELTRVMHLTFDLQL